jgi:mannose-6-phosphate isomerase-like protein (cupin superfamily)
MNTVSKKHPLSHYTWGGDCDGWNLVDDAGLSVKLERMPPGMSEQLHFHERAKQFFFILEGEAVFEIDEEIVLVHEGEGLSILPNQKHRIINSTGTDLEFILSSQPSTSGDRINLA